MLLFSIHMCCIRLGIKHRYCRIHQTDSPSLRQFLMDLKFHSVFLLTEKYGNRYIAKPRFINKTLRKCFHITCTCIKFINYIFRLLNWLQTLTPGLGLIRIQKTMITSSLYICLQATLSGSAAAGFTLTQVIALFDNLQSFANNHVSRKKCARTSTAK